MRTLHKHHKDDADATLRRGGFFMSGFSCQSVCKSNLAEDLPTKQASILTAAVPETAKS